MIRPTARDGCCVVNTLIVGSRPTGLVLLIAAVVACESPSLPIVLELHEDGASQ